MKFKIGQKLLLKKRHELKTFGGLKYLDLNFLKGKEFAISSYNSYQTCFHRHWCGDFAEGKCDGCTTEYIVVDDEPKPFFIELSPCRFKLARKWVRMK